VPDQADILISVHGRFADGMIAGSKSVELRRRAPKVAPLTRVWIYNKAPTAAVRALAVLNSIESLVPANLWDRHGSALGLTEAEFYEYVKGSETVSALIFDHVHQLRQPVKLKALRAVFEGFHPPQFYLKLHRTSAVVRRLSQEVACTCNACGA
jgi:predicted transcriptional regulator